MWDSVYILSKDIAEFRTNLTNYRTNLNVPDRGEGEFLQLSRPWKIYRSQKRGDATHEIEVC